MVLSVVSYKMQRAAQDQRTETEKAKGTADMQADLAKSQVGVDIQNNRTAARKMEAQGEATFIEQTGAAQGAQVSMVWGIACFALFGVGLGYMVRLVRKGPVTNEGKEQGIGGPGQHRTPARPLSAPGEGLEADQNHDANDGSTTNGH